MLRSSVASSGLQGTKGRAKDISEKALVKDSGPNRVGCRGGEMDTFVEECDLLIVLTQCKR